MKKSQHPGLSGFHLLPTGTEAFSARAVLAIQAAKTIDAQYYLWHDDLVGLSLLGLLKQAADRGVRVRLLIDDIALGDSDLSMAALANHPNFDIRIFNPFSRNASRARQYITRFGSVTRRMHNKSFTVDNQVAIVGGRNIGNEYFDADPVVSFGDLDAVAIGPIVDDVSASFDNYWNHPSAYPVTSLSKRSPDKERIDGVQTFLDEYLVEHNDSVYARSIREAKFVSQFQEQTLPFRWGKASLLVDDPGKLTASRNRTDLALTSQASQLIGSATKELLIFSPYFIPGKTGVAGLSALEDRGVEVNIVTNSLASNNHAVVHAKYAKYRKPLLKSGANIFEVRSQLESGTGQETAGRARNAVFHAKSFVVDRRWVFVGSLNFDPRSFVENSEIGIVFDSPELAQDIGGWFDNELASMAYELALERPNEGAGSLVWLDRGNSENTQVLKKEPETSWWLRAKTRIMSWLPGESQL